MVWVLISQDFNFRLPTISFIIARLDEKTNRCREISRRFAPCVYKLYTKKAKNAVFSVSFRTILSYALYLAESCIPADDFAQSLYVCIGLEYALDNLLHGKTSYLFAVSPGI